MQDLSESDKEVHLATASGHANTFQGTLNQVMNHVKVRDAIAKAAKAGVPFAQILAVIIPFILGIFTGTPINIQAIVAAILALINPTPVPTPTR